MNGKNRSFNDERQEAVAQASLSNSSGGGTPLPRGKSYESAIPGKTPNIDQKLDYIIAKLDRQADENKQTKDEIMCSLSKFKTESNNKILELMSENQHLRNEIKDLRKRLNNQSQSLMRNSVDIVGLPAIDDKILTER